MQAGHFAQCVVLLRIVTITSGKVVAVVIVRSVNLFHRKMKPKNPSQVMENIMLQIKNRKGRGT